ncbi:putative ATP binding L-PSP endoribonuclease family protein [Cryomyces antarcticus]
MAPTQLHVIALMSGGKDSFFSILHCLVHGHRIVALANLHPPPDAESEDIDSYMYQTVGHTVVPLYGEALDIPLYRQMILGSAVNTNKSYSPAPVRSGSTKECPDETESLVPLLQNILSEHPEANAISTGAILSDYQRTRVESVALRFGLAPLSYLWQFPYLPPYTQTSLLEDMVAIGQDSRIIKVASGGLDASFLWGNVADWRTVRKLVKAMGRFGGNEGGAVLGEGGEFETLTINGPDVLWKGRIVVEETVVTNGEGGTAALSVTKARVELKPVTEDSKALQKLRIPKLLDEEFEQLLVELPQTGSHIGTSTEQTKSMATFNLREMSHWGESRGEHVFTIANATGLGDSAHSQMVAIGERLLRLVDPSAILFTTILLRSMSDFADVNKAYGAWFTLANPPARVTVACGDTLPHGVYVMLSFVAGVTMGRPRRCLHVQSRSYWAPANIGPYSQAITIALEATSPDPSESREMVFVAGQIPLVPASMEIVSASDFRMQTTLSLQHLWRIGRAMSVDYWTAGIAFITASCLGEAKDKATTAVRAWNKAHEQRAIEELDDDVDVWDRDYGPHRSHVRGPRDTEKSHRRLLPSVKVGTAPPCFIVHVDGLPRGAQIEWQSLGLSGCHPSQIAFEVREFTRIPEEAKFPLGALHCTLYTSEPVPSGWMSSQILPCRSLWDASGERLAAVATFR